MDTADAATRDATLADALEHYRDRCREGHPPDPESFADAYPDVAEELRHCLDALSFLYASRPALPAQTIGDYELIREIGRGGMGVVYEAEEMSLGRRVALKVLPFAGVLSPRERKRFRNEALAAAQLEHPNIVSVYAVGAERGVHHYAMQLVEGLSLAELIAELREGESGSVSAPARAVTGLGAVETRKYVEAIARLGVQAARGLHHAHEEGVVHRDVKPGNLLVDDDAHLRIADFGLATFRNDPGLTLTGDLVGTVRYMSPEQALGHREKLDHRTDVYSLGVTLYEMLTLRPAFEGSDPHTLIEAIVERDPPALRSLNPAVPAELETVVSKAMEKEPADRYATATDLAADLERFLENRPVLARRPTLVKRATKWTVRHRGIVWTAAAVLLLAIVGLSIGTVLVARQRDRARAHFASARNVIELMLDRLSDVVAYEQLGATQRSVLAEALSFYEGFVAGEEPQAGRSDPDVARAYEGTGRVLHLLGRHAEAQIAFLAALDGLDPASAHGLRVRERLGQLHVDQGRKAEARAVFEACLRETTEPLARARLLAAIGSASPTEDALAHYEGALQALSALPETPERRYAEARCLLSLVPRLAEVDPSPEVGRLFTQGYHTARELCAEYPEDPRYPLLLAEYYDSGLNLVGGTETDSTPGFELPLRGKGPETPVPLGAEWRSFEACLETSSMEFGEFHVAHASVGWSNLVSAFDAKCHVVFCQAPKGPRSIAKCVLRDRGDEDSALWVDCHATLDPRTRGFGGTFVIAGGTGRYEGATGDGRVFAIDRPELGEDAVSHAPGARVTLAGRIRRR